MIKFTNEEIEQMILFYKNGMSIVDIGKHFGVCNATIKNRLIKAGVEIKKYSTIEIPEDVKSKMCNCCKRILPLEAFHKGTGKFGRRSECKECCKKKYESGDKGEERREHRRLKKIEKRLDPIYRELERARDNERLANNSISYKKSLLRGAQQRAKNKNIEFNIGIEDFEIPERCPLLGIPLNNHIGEQTLQDDSPSLDRIDSSKGYIPGNVWIISNKANRAKNNLTLSELQQLVSNLENKYQSLSKTMIN